MFMNKPRECNFVWEVISQKCGHTDRKIGFELCDMQGERGDVVFYVANPGP